MGAAGSNDLGSFVAAVAAALEQRVFDGYQAAGFRDIRAAHAHIFRLLPPKGCRVTELAERVYSSKQAMGYLVEYLEEQGYVERSSDPTMGGRKSSAALSEVGK